MPSEQSSGVVRVHLQGGGYVRGMGDPGDVNYSVIHASFIRLPHPGDEHAQYVPSDRVLWVEEETESSS